MGGGGGGDSTSFWFFQLMEEKKKTFCSGLFPENSRTSEYQIVTPGVGAHAHTCRLERIAIARHDDDTYEILLPYRNKRRITHVCGGNASVTAADLRHCWRVCGGGGSDARINNVRVASSVTTTTTTTTLRSKLKCLLVEEIKEKKNRPNYARYIRDDDGTAQTFSVVGRLEKKN